MSEVCRNEDLPYLSGARVALRLPRIADSTAIEDYAIRNRGHLAPTSPPRTPEYYTRGYWRRLVPRLEEEFREDRGLRLVVLKHGDPKSIIGMVSFSQVVRGAFQACYLGYEIDAEEQGKGLMTEALGLAIPYVFGPLNLHRIMANHLPENTRSARVLQKLGFLREGYAPQYLFIDGEWRDHVLNSLTNRFWKAL